MNPSNLFGLIQNSAIGAIALQSFTLGYYGVAKNKEKENPFPKIDYLFYVLPIVYNQSSMNTFRSSNQLYTALLANKAIPLGLQERANKMSQQTFDALNLAFSKQILNYNKEFHTIGLSKGYNNKKLILPMGMSYAENSVKKIQDSAFKLGSLFAKRNKKNIQVELNIKL